MSFLSSSFADNKLQTFAVAAILLLVACGFLYLLYRGLSGSRNKIAGARGRQQRLGVVDSYDIDKQRQLVIIRRDNTEHLLMIGGPNDLVVESTIVRVEARDTRSRERERENGAPSWAAPEKAQEAAMAPPPPLSNPYPESISAPQPEPAEPPVKSRELPKLPDLFARSKKPAQMPPAAPAPEKLPEPPVMPVLPVAPPAEELVILETHASATAEPDRIAAIEIETLLETAVSEALLEVPPAPAVPPPAPPPVTPAPPPFFRRPASLATPVARPDGARMETGRPEPRPIPSPASPAPLRPAAPSPFPPRPRPLATPTPQPPVVHPAPPVAAPPVVPAPRATHTGEPAITAAADPMESLEEEMAKLLGRPGA